MPEPGWPNTAPSAVKIDPAGTVELTSRGSTRYPSGTRVRLPTIFGHRDVSATECPGREFYRRLPQLRERVGSLAQVVSVASAGVHPIAGDWNGDGVDTIGFYNSATGAFFLKNSNANGYADISFVFGVGGAAPVAGDVRVDYTARLIPVAGRSGGDLSLELAVSAHAFSKSAVEKIEAAGGSVTWLKPPKVKKGRVRKAAAAPEPEPEAPEEPEAEAPAEEA